MEPTKYFKKYCRHTYQAIRLLVSHLLFCVCIYY